MITIQDLDLMNKKKKDMKEMVRTRQQRQTRQKGKKQEQHDWLFNSIFQAACVTQLSQFLRCSDIAIVDHYLANFRFWQLFCELLFWTTCKMSLWVIVLQIFWCWLIFAKLHLQVIVCKLSFWNFCNLLLLMIFLQIIPMVNFWRHTYGQGQCDQLINGQ